MFFFLFKTALQKSKNCQIAFCKIKRGNLLRSKVKLMHHYSKLKLLIHSRKLKNKCHSSIFNHLLIKEKNKLRVQFLNKDKYTCRASAHHFFLALLSLFAPRLTHKIGQTLWHKPFYVCSETGAAAQLLALSSQPDL